ARCTIVCMRRGWDMTTSPVGFDACWLPALDTFDDWSSDARAPPLRSDDEVAFAPGGTAVPFVARAHFVARANFAAAAAAQRALRQAHGMARHAIPPAFDAAQRGLLVLESP